VDLHIQFQNLKNFPIHLKYQEISDNKI